MGGGSAGRMEVGSFDIKCMGLKRLCTSHRTIRVQIAKCEGLYFLNPLLFLLPLVSMKLITAFAK
jgi:hypothetical protein